MNALRSHRLMVKKEELCLGLRVEAVGSLFVESSKVFMSRVDTPENLERFGSVPNLWRTP